MDKKILKIFDEIETIHTLAERAKMYYFVNIKTFDKLIRKIKRTKKENEKSARTECCSNTNHLEKAINYKYYVVYTYSKDGGEVTGCIEIDSTCKIDNFETIKNIEKIIKEKHQPDSDVILLNWILLK